MQRALPSDLRSLFWDVEFATIDAQAHRAFVLDRLLEYGNLRAIQWAEQFYGLGGIREYFLSRGARVLTPKTRAFWQAVFELPQEACTTKSSLPHKNPPWLN